MTKDEYVSIITGLMDTDKFNIEEEKDFNSESQHQILERDRKYSELLEHFVTITIKRNRSKEKNKWIYFRVIMAILILLNLTIFATIITILVKCNSEQIISSIPLLITAITGFTSSIIAIPVTITKYLFSTKEDKYITNIISHTQEHDLSSKKILKTIVDNMQKEETE